MKKNLSVVHFHIGRGGDSRNAGHKSFVGVETLQDIIGDYFVIEEDAEGNQLPDKDWKLTDESGNVLLEGRDEVESETGVIDEDGEYNTDICEHVDECSGEELNLLYNALDTVDAIGLTDDDINYIKANAPAVKEKNLQKEMLQAQLGLDESSDVRRWSELS